MTIGYMPVGENEIYPYYTNHKKIRIRRKKKVPTTAHSIDWFYIEKLKEFHEDLMKIWEKGSVNLS